MIDLTKMTVTELKAAAYDVLAQREQLTMALNAINAEIARRPDPPKPEGEPNP